ncbi:MAG: alkaline phosphatase family protein [Spirochaetales bacterium]|nr:alkaline phosphatase family protein [Spirochaetales bacterium]
MSELNSISLTRFASTISDMFGTERPREADGPVDWAVDAMKDICRDGFDRVFIMNPDCCAQWMYEKHPDAIFPVLRNTQITIPFRTVLPSVTPVCFGTMYTGVLPEVHGIRKYEKPVIRTDSLFDALIRSGKKVALVSQPKASMSNIFLERDFDIYNCACEGECVEKARELIMKDEYDVVILYTYMYDTQDHRFGPESKEAVAALYQQSAEFDMLVSDIRRVWRKHNTLVSFSTDHGCHETVPCEGNKFHKGDHGSDSPLDLNILHFMGAIRRQEE